MDLFRETLGGLGTARNFRRRLCLEKLPAGDPRSFKKKRTPTTLAGKKRPGTRMIRKKRRRRKEQRKKPIKEAR